MRVLLLALLATAAHAQPGIEEALNEMAGAAMQARTVPKTRAEAEQRRERVRRLMLAQIGARSADEDRARVVAIHEAAPSAFPNGTHVAEVEIDPDTGVVEVVAHTAVDDFGNIINPMIVEGQVHGGVTQGIEGNKLDF